MPKKKILIIDEYGFSRVCSVLLDSIGYSTALASNINSLRSDLTAGDVGLIVASYPYVIPFFAGIRNRRIPTLILSNNVDDDLINILSNIDNSFCMIKPLDYSKFKSLVGQLMSGEVPLSGGYNIV
jgi:hypothetical protein